jgi:WD40 repeat protein
MTGDASPEAIGRLPSSANERVPDFLVSCVEADQAWAEWIGWQVTAAGFVPAVEAWTAPGSSVVGWLDDAIRNSKRTLVVLSPEALRSPDALAAWEAAFRSDPVGAERRLIPVIVKSCRLRGLLAGRRSITLADLDEQEAREALLAGLAAATSGQALPRSEPKFPGRGRGQTRRPAPGFPGIQLPEELTDLLGRVAEAYQDRFPDASVSRAISENGTRYLRIEARLNETRQRWPVGVVAGNLDAEALAAFVEQVHTPHTQQVTLGESDLVYGGALSDDLVRRSAGRLGVNVQSIHAVELGWDPARYRTRQAQRLARDHEYPPDLYVAQRFVRFDDPPITAPYPDVFAAILDWLDSVDARLVLVLADFGHGKTFLTHELARRVPDQLPRLTPMLINLRTFEKSHSLDTVLAVHLSECGEDGVPVRAVRRMLDRGQLLLIFDGFDELAVRLTYDAAAEHLKMILSAVTGRAKVIVTSRTQHFASDRQWLTALGEQVNVLPAARTVRLAGFDDVQILEFLTRHYARSPSAALTSSPAEAARSRLQLVDGVTDLHGLSQTPRMLAFIADLPDNDLLSARTADGTITQASLYQILVDRWLRFEADRRRPTRGTQPSLTAQQLRTVASAIALRLWTTGQDSLDLTRLGTVVDEALPELGTTHLEPAQALFTVGSGSLLVRDEAGRFSFVHASVLEYLVAVAAADQLTATGTSELVRIRQMPALAIDFLVGTAPRAILEQWVREVLAEMDPTEQKTDRVARRRGWRRALPAPNNRMMASATRREPEGATRLNALEVSRRLNLRVTGINLAGQDLRRIELSRHDLRNADLSGANLQDVRLTGLDLSGADLTGSNLRGAHLSDIDLNWTCLNRADLTEAYLLRPRLRGVSLVASRWDHAALIFPILDADALRSPELSYAAITGRDAAKPRWLSHRATCLAFAPDGQTLASGGTATNTVRLWDVETGRSTSASIVSIGDVGLVTFTRDGRIIAVGTTPSGGAIRLSDLANSAQIQVITPWSRGAATAAVTADEKTIALGAADSSGLVLLCDIATATPVREIQISRRRVVAVDFAPDGRILAGSDGGVSSTVLVDTNTGKTIRTLRGDRHAVVGALAFSPDGRTLATGGDNNGDVLLWDVATGRLSGELANPVSGVGPVTTLAFAPDGRTLASGHGAGPIHLWDIMRNISFATFIDLRSGGSAVLLPDGTYKTFGNAGNDLWWVIKGQRFAPGELDGAETSLRRVGSDDSIAR